MKIRRRRKSFIGLDIGGRTIRAVQLTLSDRARPRLDATAVIPRLVPDGPDLAPEAERVAGILERRGFTGRDVVLCVPDDQLISATIDVPPRESGAPVEQIAQAELARIHRRDPDSLEMACWDLPAPARSASAAVLAVACPRDAAEHLIGAVDGAGLRVRGLDVRVLAMARAVSEWAHGSGEIAGMAGVLDLGWNQGVLGVLRDGTVVFERLLQEAGLSRLHADLAERLGLDADLTEHLVAEVGLGDGGGGRLEQSELITEARRLIEQYADSIAEQVSASFAYVGHRFQEQGIPRLALAGESGDTPGLAARLAARLEVDVSTVRPSDAADVSGAEAGAGDRPSATAALGLALYPRELAA